MIRSQIQVANFIKRGTISIKSQRYVATLTPEQVTEILKRNEAHIPNEVLPNYIKSIECNQLASNRPIEDRLRISSISLPGVKEPTLLLGVFDGHGGGTTADLISRRLFNYIAISLYPKQESLSLTNHEDLKSIVVDLHNSPKPLENTILNDGELQSLSDFKEKLTDSANIAANIKASFKKCDDDLSREIQYNLMHSPCNQSTLHYYLSAAVSGCCALVMVIHQGMGYLASAGDCRAVLGIYEQKDYMKQSGSSKGINQLDYRSDQRIMLNAIELNEEHNCDNIYEIRRLAATHPNSEQNTIIRHNRLLGHLMPFRAFGDFNYKWPADIIKQCGLTKAYGSGVIPSNYKTPPYLIVEPDVKEININEHDHCEGLDRNLVIASDGLWELFESSREVIEATADHRTNASQLAMKEDYDDNCATHILRAALRSSSHQDFGLDREELKRLYHIRLESTLTLPQSVVRNFRDDISIVLLKL